MGFAHLFFAFSHWPLAIGFLEEKGGRNDRIYRIYMIYRVCAILYFLYFLSNPQTPNTSNTPNAPFLQQDSNGGRSREQTEQ